MKGPEDVACPQAMANGKLCFRTCKSSQVESSAGMPVHLIRPCGITASPSSPNDDPESPRVQVRPL